MNIVIDVREEWEFESGNHPGSLNIPLGEIVNRIDDIKKYEKVFLVCQSGNRANFAKSILDKNKINCENLGSWQNVRKVTGQ